MKTKKKTVTAKELLKISNDFHICSIEELIGCSFDINDIQGSFENNGSHGAHVLFKGYPNRDSWYVNDDTDFYYLLYMLSLLKHNDDWFYGPEQEAEERLKKYFNKDSKKVRKTRSDKGKKRGKYHKKAEEPVEYTFNVKTPFLQVDPVPSVPPSGSVFESLEKILSVLQDINSKIYR